MTLEEAKAAYMDSGEDTGAFMHKLFSKKTLKNDEQLRNLIIEFRHRFKERFIITIEVYNEKGMISAGAHYIGVLPDKIQTLESLS